MKKILEALNEWLAWFESRGEEFPPALVEENAVIGFDSHGFSSNRFVCRFEAEKVGFDVELLMNDRDGEEDAEAIVKLALVALATPFDEKVEVSVSDRFASYNGGTLEDFLHLIDRISVSSPKNGEVICP